MALGLWNAQWLNQNSQRAYPLADWGNATDRSGTVQIPNSFLLTLLFPVPATTNVLPERFFLQSLGVYPTGYAINIGYDDGGSAPPLVASTYVAKATHTENRTYALTGLDTFAECAGQVVIGRLDDMEQLSPGQYFFLPAATPLETDCIRPVIRGITSLTVVNGTDRSVPLYGDIELIAGPNCRIAVGTSGPSGAQIVFSAISGEGLIDDCVCDNAEALGPPIRFINGIPPLPDGNYRLVGDDCLTLTPMANGITLQDKCSAPCCGCTTLDPLVRQIDRFADGVVTLQSYANNLGGQVTQMGLVVLGSRLGDPGCFQVP